MASNKHEQEDKTLESLNNSLTSAGESIVKNSKVILYCICGVVVIALGIFGYIFFIKNPNNKKASDEFNKVEITANGNDSIAIAGYKNVADKYKGTDGGNLAAAFAGEKLYDQGKYEEAIKYLEQFDTNEEVSMAAVQCLIGDCYVNLKKYDDALNYFDKAISTAKGNEALVPRFLDKKATVFDAQKQYAKALECYETIKKDYPSFGGQAFGIDSYIEREKARLGK